MNIKRLSIYLRYEVPGCPYKHVYRWKLSPPLSFWAYTSLILRLLRKNNLDQKLLPSTTRRWRVCSHTVCVCAIQAPEQGPRG